MKMRRSQNMLFHLSSTYTSPQMIEWTDSRLSRKSWNTYSGIFREQWLWLQALMWKPWTSSACEELTLNRRLHWKRHYVLRRSRTTNCGTTIALSPLEYRQIDLKKSLALDRSLGFVIPDDILSAEKAWNYHPHDAIHSNGLSKTMQKRAHAKNYTRTIGGRQRYQTLDVIACHCLGW